MPFAHWTDDMERAEIDGDRDVRCEKRRAGFFFETPPLDSLRLAQWRNGGLTNFFSLSLSFFPSFFFNVCTVYNPFPSPWTKQRALFLSPPRSCIDRRATAIALVLLSRSKCGFIIFRFRTCPPRLWDFREERRGFRGCRTPGWHFRGNTSIVDQKERSTSRPESTRHRATGQVPSLVPRKPPNVNVNCHLIGIRRCVFDSIATTDPRTPGENDENRFSRGSLPSIIFVSRLRARPSFQKMI